MKPVYESATLQIIVCLMLFALHGIFIIKEIVRNSIIYFDILKSYKTKRWYIHSSTKNQN